MQNAPDFLGDIGIDVPEAQAEAMHFFWEPVKLLRKTGDATAWSKSRYWRLAPTKAWLSALTRPTNLRITNPQTHDCIFFGKHDDVLARVTSS